MRTCKNCDNPTVSPRHWYCEFHRDQALIARTLRNRELSRRAETPERRRERYRREADRGRPSPTERGYGREHARLRREWAPLVAAGEVACARCGRQIKPGQRWHLDHDDDDRTMYLGPSHAHCNTNSKAKPLTPARLEEIRRDEARRARAAAAKSAVLYGPEHVELRRQWTPEVDAGRTRCARCGEFITPGEPWDLGHDDDDPAFYSGPEHRSCNRRAGGRQTQRRSGLPTVTSRQWLPT